jgi:hypothetical protein
MPVDDRQRLLKDIEGLRQRCLQEGGSGNMAAMRRLKELEDQIRGGGPMGVGLGLGRPPSSAYPPTPFTGAGMPGTAFPTYAMPPELAGLGAFGDPHMYGQPPPSQHQQQGLLQVSERL